MQKLILSIIVLLALGWMDLRAEQLSDDVRAYQWNWTDSVSGKRMSQFRPVRLSNKYMHYGTPSGDLQSPERRAAYMATDAQPENSAYIFKFKTNLLYDAALIPNIGLEFPVSRHLSINADWMYAWWSNHDKNRHWRIYGGDLGLRYYFSSGCRDRWNLTGHHIGLYGQVLVFQIAFGGKGYITGIPGENLWGKPYLGGGVEYGYTKRIGRRLNLDFSLGIGYMAGEYRVYRPDQGHYLWQSSHKRNWFGPTKAEISLQWLIGKMPKKGGAR